MAQKNYQKLGLYIHIPFCKHKCAYCDFYSCDNYRMKGTHSTPEMKAFVGALTNHMIIVSDRTTEYDIDSVFIGGGTPTAIGSKELLSIVQNIPELFYMGQDVEFTVEVNPGSINAHLLKQLHRLGVNRLSIGMQSANDNELRALSRIHTVQQAKDCFEAARDAGFDNINVDIMYGIPNQTPQSFARTLEFIGGLDPEHVSMYGLMIEEGTPFARHKDQLRLPDEDTEYQMYFDGIAFLEKHGYAQYEISNFAKRGFECRHNLKYWSCEEYMGIGPAAHSYFGGTRFSIKPDVELYNRALEKRSKMLPGSILDENIKIGKKEQITEFIMLQLRTRRGLYFDEFSERFGANFLSVFGKRLQPYIENGFMTVDNAHVAFTPKGMYVSNYILANILPTDSPLEQNLARSV